MDATQQDETSKALAQFDDLLGEAQTLIALHINSCVDRVCLIMKLRICIFHYNPVTWIMYILLVW